MALGSVLIADDEETFLESTSLLLRHEGFDCDTVQDPGVAIDRLGRASYDVLVSDIHMPPSPDLRIIKDARELDCRLPIIVVTGYPSAETAINAIGCRIEAYLTKPLDFEGLLWHIRCAVQKSLGRRRTTSVIERLCSVVADLEAQDCAPLARHASVDESSLTTIRTLASCLSDLLILWRKPAADRGLTNHLCELLDCPQCPSHRHAILHAIEVLRKTKDSFKSKQLAQLRLELERAMEIS